MASASPVSRRLADTLLYQKSSSLVCRSCRHQALRQRLNLLHQSRSASDKPLPFTEKVRRKTWGIDKPPGMKDPFGGPSFLEKRRMKKAEERGEEYLPVEEESQELEAGPEEYYVPAETWDGLEHMGHKGHWADIPPRPEDSYRP
jgi:hypothetical protein